ncbi:MAG TPA: hypothetical protein DEA08_00915 [Planctomycetes bacterium]|nr:hypothetical protein [Planctomycetota bacterium]
MRTAPNYLLPAFLVGAALFALGSVVSQPAAAQQARVTQWEYRCFRLDPKDYEDKEDYKQIYKKVGRRGAEAAFYERVLDYMGKDGWELVSVERRTPAVVYLYLKRRLS